MEMHQVRYFVALAEELNFTKAAVRCHVSQPALTRAIRSLEQELGGALLRRERLNTHLTELGAVMRPYLVAIVERADAAKKHATDLRKGARERLRLGVMCTIAPEPLLKLVEALRTNHPDVDLEITDARACDLEELLLHGKLDVAIYCRPDHTDERMHYLPVFTERMMIVLHPEHELAGRDTLGIEDLRCDKYLNRSNCEYNESFEWKRQHVAWNKVIRSERDDWLLAMIAAGMGFGFFPEYSIRHPGVVAKPTTDPAFKREVFIATVRGRRFSASVGALIHEAMRNDWQSSRSAAAGSETENRTV